MDKCTFLLNQFLIKIRYLHGIRLNELINNRFYAGKISRIRHAIVYFPK